MIRAYALGYHFYNLKEKLFYVRIQQTSLRSVSRKYAYEQYINTLRVKKQFKEFRQKHLKAYPNLPELIYDLNDKKNINQPYHSLTILENLSSRKESRISSPYL